MDFLRDLVARARRHLLLECWWLCRAIGGGGLALAWVLQHKGWMAGAVVFLLATEVLFRWLFWEGRAGGDVFGGASWAEDLETISKAGLKGRR